MTAELGPAILRRRPVLVALASTNAILGALTAAVTFSIALGADLDSLRLGAAELARSPVVSPSFLYTPVAAAAFVPLLVVPIPILTASWIAVEVTLILVGIAIETRGWSRLDRALLIVAVLTWVPVVNELILCQFTIVLAATLVAAIRGRDRPLVGLPLGIALATIPKPLLLPVLVWMAWRRPRALVFAIATAAVITAAGLLVLGPDRYIAWVGSLVQAGSVTRHGNLSLWADGVSAIAVVIAGVATALFVVALRRDADAGLAAALVAGVLLAPYSLAYSASMLLVGVPAALRVHRNATIALALTSALAIFSVFAAWCMAALAILAKAARWRGTPVDSAR